MEESKNFSPVYNSLLYALFVFLMVYRVVIKEDYLDGASSLGIALIFDPFDQNRKWNDRPLWQRAWLIVHLLLLVVLFVVGISHKM